MLALRECTNLHGRVLVELERRGRERQTRDTHREKRGIAAWPGIDEI